jgi:hypothetical protein
MNTQIAQPKMNSSTCRMKGKVSAGMGEVPDGYPVLVGARIDPVHGANIVRRQRDNCIG